MEDNLKKVLEINALYDLYGSLLTPRQQKVIVMYYEENLSLIEISEIENISKNGVYDALIKAEHILLDYEEKLGFLKKENEFKKKIETLYKKGHLDDVGFNILKGED